MTGTKFDPKSSSNKFKKCFYCDKVGHIRADCRKKKRDDEERRIMSAQNSLNLFEHIDEPTRTHKRFDEHFWGQLVVSPTAHHSFLRLG